MNPCIVNLKASWLLCLFTLLLAVNLTSASTKLTPKAIEKMQLDQAGSFRKIGAALKQFEAAAKRATAAKPPNFPLQLAMVTAAGASVGRILTLYQDSSRSASQRKKAEALLQLNRALLQHIVKENEALIRHYQEHELDQMEDPLKFFKSDAWQSPQNLISIASYWLGWNGYYSSLLIPAEEPLRKTMLEESIEAFSRSFIDFQEDEITTKSLYGRGLVYKQLKIYGRAAYDFKSVRQKLKRSDPLYLNCLYQEAVVSHEVGNDKVTKSLLKAIKAHYPAADIPEVIRIGIKQLETQMLMAAGRSSPKSERKLATAKSPVDHKTPVEPSNTQADFKRLRAVAKNDPDLFGEFYRYSKEHASEIAALPYKELTPVAAFAIADWHFSAKKFNAALPIYERLLRDQPKVIRKQADGLWLRTAYIYNQRKQWDKVSQLLKRFSARFPRSRQLKQVAELYYSASLEQYRKTSSQPDYQTHIAATHNYLKQCEKCRFHDTAHYQLGRHYIEQKKLPEAMAAFSNVSKQSSHYYVARYHLADAQISALESLQRSGELHNNSQTSKRHQAAQRILKDYAKNGVNKKGATLLQPNWVLLQARFNLLTTAPNYRRAITLLKDFEKRFPKATAIWLQVSSTRIVAYQQLGQQKNWQAEINGMAGRAKNNPDYYQRLQVLANRFYSEFISDSTKSSDNQLTNPTTSGAEVALSLYQQLATISRSSRDYQPYLQAINLRIGDLYHRQKQLPEALKIYRQLVAENPDSADSLIALGDLYQEMEQWQNSIDIWRQVSDGLKAGSPRWYQARYQTAFAMQQLNRTSQACSIAKMTRILHPDISKQTLALQFQAIEASSCGKLPENQSR